MEGDVPSWRGSCSKCGTVNTLRDFGYCEMKGCIVIHPQIEQKCSYCGNVMVEGL